MPRSCLRQLLLVLAAAQGALAGGRSSPSRPVPRRALLLSSPSSRHDLIADNKKVADVSSSAANGTDHSNSTAVQQRPGLIRRFQLWLDSLHSAAITRMLVTACVYWMAYASWQMNRDMQLFTNPLRDVGKQTKKAAMELKKNVEKVKVQAAPVTAKATKSLVEGSAVAGRIAAKKAAEAAAKAREAAEAKAPAAREVVSKAGLSMLRGTRDVAGRAGKAMLSGAGTLVAMPFKPRPPPPNPPPPPPKKRPPPLPPSRPPRPAPARPAPPKPRAPSPEQRRRTSSPPPKPRPSDGRACSPTATAIQTAPRCLYAS